MDRNRPANETTAEQLQDTKDRPVPDFDRSALMNQEDELRSLIEQQPINLEYAVRVCQLLYRDLGGPTTNALWAQRVLHQLAHIASEPQTTDAIRAAIREHVIAYYEQQKPLQAGESQFVSPYCMKVLGDVLTRCGGDSRSTELGEALQQKAAHWMRSLGYEDYALEMEEDALTALTPGTDLVSELLTTYGELLDRRTDLPRAQMTRMQRTLCALLKSNELQTRRQWELWRRVMGRIGKQADATTRHLIQERLKTTEEEPQRRILESVWKHIR